MMLKSKFKDIYNNRLIYNCSACLGRGRKIPWAKSEFVTVADYVKCDDCSGTGFHPIPLEEFDEDFHAQFPQW